jgi:hypothetical protein
MPIWAWGGLISATFCPKNRLVIAPSVPRLARSLFFDEWPALFSGRDAVDKELTLAFRRPAEKGPDPRAAWARNLASVARAENWNPLLNWKGEQNRGNSETLDRGLRLTRQLL